MDLCALVDVALGNGFAFRGAELWSEFDVAQAVQRHRGHDRLSLQDPLPVPGLDNADSLGTAVVRDDLGDYGVQKDVASRVSQDGPSEGGHATFAQLVDTCQLEDLSHIVPTQSVPAQSFDEADLTAGSTSKRIDRAFEGFFIEGGEIELVEASSNSKMIVFLPGRRCTEWIMRVGHKLPAVHAVDIEELFGDTLYDSAELAAVDLLHRTLGLSIKHLHRFKGACRCLEMLVEVVPVQLVVQMWLIPMHLIVFVNVREIGPLSLSSKALSVHTHVPPISKFLPNASAVHVRPPMRSRPSTSNTFR